MDSSVLLSLVGVAVVLSIIFLMGLCLNCKGNSQPKFISQQYPQTSIPSPLVDTRRSPSHSFDCESQTEYVNQEDNCEGPEIGYEVPPDKNQDYPDYLDVLPDDTHVSQQSIASSANSGQNYENVHNDEDNDPDSDSQEYINVAPEKMGLHFHTPIIIGSFESRSSEGQDSLDYVNAEAVGMNHMC
ncbi:hypothetical protein NFI96_020303 [Prochilodus magdalenae]|nr:hypothetical protein NFI96_020303 [Prochilodus magdalenae]